MATAMTRMSGELGNVAFSDDCGANHWLYGQWRVTETREEGETSYEVSDHDGDVVHETDELDGAPEVMIDGAETHNVETRSEALAGEVSGLRDEMEEVFGLLKTTASDCESKADCDA